MIATEGPKVKKIRNGTLSRKTLSPTDLQSKFVKEPPNLISVDGSSVDFPQHSGARVGKKPHKRRRIRYLESGAFSKRTVSPGHRLSGRTL